LIELALWQFAEVCCQQSSFVYSIAVAPKKLVFLKVCWLAKGVAVSWSANEKTPPLQQWGWG
jgi:hypothetical protein